jgi:hypothetical protein
VAGDAREGGDEVTIEQQYARKRRESRMLYYKQTILWYGLSRIIYWRFS